MGQMRLEMNAFSDDLIKFAKREIKINYIRRILSKIDYVPEHMLEYVLQAADRDSAQQEEYQLEKKRKIEQIAPNSVPIYPTIQ
jgi:hypothetical protein